MLKNKIEKQSIKKGQKKKSRSTLVNLINLDHETEITQ
jgi:hypothetical protein